MSSNFCYSVWIKLLSQQGMYCNNYLEFTLKFADCSGMCHLPGDLPNSHVLGSSPAAGFETALFCLWMLDFSLFWVPSGK